MNTEISTEEDQIDNQKESVQLAIDASAWGLVAIEIIKSRYSGELIMPSINEETVARKAVWLARYAREEAEDSCS